MPQVIPFLGYAPDLDPTSPGVMTNCDAIVPTMRGFKGAPSPVTTTLPALAAQCFGAAAILKRDDTTRVFVGTVDHLYESAGTVWTDRSGTIAGLGTNNRWRFAQFGDTTLASAKTEIPQQITTGSVFAVCTSVAPRCGIIETVNNFLMAFDVNDQGTIYDSADRPDGWWCAAKGGFTSWVPSVTTEAATGTLQSTPGKITGGKRFGYQVVAYKRTSMYLGTYVGQPQIWDFALIPGSAGALSHEAIVDIGTPENPKHIFMGQDNFYQYDGGRPVPIGNPIREHVFSELNTQVYYAAHALHDFQNKLVYFYYPSSSSNIPDKCVVYNYLTGRWGRDNRSIEMSMSYISIGVTYDGLGALYATYDDLPNLSYDLAFSSTGTPQAAIFNTSHLLQTLTGASVTSSITTGDYGDDQAYSTLSRVRPAFLTAPTSAGFVHFYKHVLSDSLTQGAQVGLISGKFDVLRSARWHRGRFDMTGNHEITGFSVDVMADGER